MRARARLLKSSEIACETFRRRGSIKDGLMPGTAALIGLLMALSGSERWGNESLALAMDFPFQPAAGGITIMALAALMVYGVRTDRPVPTYLASWGLALIFGAMSAFALAAYLNALKDVDNLAWVLWFYLSTDFIIKAQSHWPAK